MGCYLSWHVQNRLCWQIAEILATVKTFEQKDVFETTATADTSAVDFPYNHCFVYVWFSQTTRVTKKAKKSSKNEMDLLWTIFLFCELYGA